MFLQCVWLCATLWTVAHQAPLSLGFFRQEYWRGLPCPTPGDLSHPGIEPASPALQADSSLSHQETQSCSHKVLKDWPHWFHPLICKMGILFLSQNVNMERNTGKISDSTCALKCIQMSKTVLTASNFGKCLHHASLSVGPSPWPVGGQSLWELMGTGKVTFYPGSTPLRFLEASTCFATFLAVPTWQMPKPGWWPVDWCSPEAWQDSRKHALFTHMPPHLAHVCVHTLSP